MFSFLYRLICLLFTSVLIHSCSSDKYIADSTAANTRSRCHAIYDAGSSGTRLIIYQHKNAQWTPHKGAKVAALADSIRTYHGKRFNDLNTAIAEIITALDSIRANGAMDKYGKTKWHAFDWKTQCQLESVQVLATAGMRFAEYENPQGSRILWQKLRQKLQEKVGNSVSIITRTLTGFEEGLFAWLAVKEMQKNKAFGIAEMGGASAQITFPCEHCSNDNNAVHPIIIDNKIQKMYSYSFLGLGQDEVTKVLGIPHQCAYGIALHQANWNINHCYNNIHVAEFAGLRDPYNFHAGLRSGNQQLPIHQADIQKWVLTGAFNYSKESDIQNCCKSKGQCYQAKIACFRSIYLRKYLNLMGIPSNSEKQQTSWTLGAVVCAETKCLAKLDKPLSCRWTAKGCLK